MIQMSVAAVAEAPAVLLVPLAAAMLMCAVACYAVVFGIYLVSGAGGIYNPIVGELLVVPSENAVTMCSAQVILQIPTCKSKVAVPVLLRRCI